MTMHTYRKFKHPDGINDFYAVGVWRNTFDEDGTGHPHWEPVHEFLYQEQAECYVNYLNGGKGELFIEPNL